MDTFPGSISSHPFGLGKVSLHEVMAQLGEDDSTCLLTTATASLIPFYVITLAYTMTF